VRTANRIPFKQAWPSLRCLIPAITSKKIGHIIIKVKANSSVLQGRRHGNGKELDGVPVEEGHGLVVEEDHAPHEGGEPEAGVAVGGVLADHDGVGHREQAHHRGVPQERHDGRVVDGPLRMKRTKEGERKTSWHEERDA